MRATLHPVEQVVEHSVDVGDGVELWVQECGDPSRSAVLLVMGANSSGLVWPDALLERLGERHHVIRYDHRDTGRSSHAFDRHPYPLRRLAEDAVAVLDALGVDRAHVVGMSMGGTLAQLLLLDHPGRLLSATLLATGALGGAPGGEALPGPSAELLALWATLGEDRDDEAELDWRVEHWRILNGGVVPFDPEELRRTERRVLEHGGRHPGPVAHALADPAGLDRGRELAAVEVPTLVVEAPADPAYPPPHAPHLAASLGRARLVTVPGMGHALTTSVLGPFGDALSEHLDEVDRRGR